MYIKVFQAASFIAFAIVASIIIGSRIMLTPVTDQLNAEHYATLQQALTIHIGPFMGVMMILTLALTSATAFLFYKQRGIQFYLIALAAFCIIASMASTFILNVPANEIVKGWDVTNPPSDWIEQRTRWELGHTIRTVLMSIGLSSLFLAALLPQKQNRKK